MPRSRPELTPQGGLGSDARLGVPDVTSTPTATREARAAAEEEALRQPPAPPDQGGDVEVEPSPEPDQGTRPD